jgi:peptidoglycan/LPS O-acetylase OafA/YrhL
VARTSLREIFYRKEGSHLDALDGVRALSVVWVTMYHAWLFRCGFYDAQCGQGYTVEPFSVSIFGALVGRGDLAVDVFFALSGFLIFRILRTSLVREELPLHRKLARFTLRRLLRIYPALAVAIPLNVLIFYFVPFPGVPTGMDNVIVSGCAAHPWANFALLGNWTALGGQSMPFDGQPLGCLPWAWSVSMEAQFYLLSPLLALYYLWARARMREQGKPVRWWTGSLATVGLMLASWLAALGIGLYFDLAAVPVRSSDGQSWVWERAQTYMTWVYGNSLTRVVPFLLGVAAAAYRWHTDTEAPPAQESAGSDRTMRLVGRGVAVVGVIFLLLGALPMTQWRGLNLFLMLLGRSIFGLITALVLAIGAAPRAAQIWWVRLLRHPCWAPIARLSYSMYLWQFVGIEIARALVEGVGTRPDRDFASLLAFEALGLGLTFAIAIPAYLLIEKPGMELRPAS